MVSIAPFEQSLFHQSLQEHGVGPFENEEIYEYYQKRYYEGAKVLASRIAPDSIFRILAADASNDQTDQDSVHQWRRRKEPIGTGGQAAVWLWEKLPTSDNGDELLRVAVKDVLLNEFWKDQPTEGILLRKLHDVGCKTVVTVYDWIYKEASRSSENPIVRIVEEYAEHGDLESVIRFYEQNRLVLPEAFLWHVFWSGANALCYCRHGTTNSPETIEGWDPMTHMDIKPTNFLMARPDASLSELYPSIKMSDFGAAYTLPETGYDRLRGWKSTWTFGTRGFRAPEVEHMIRPKQGSFSPVQPSALHGSHTDIYSLGQTIFTLMDRSARAVRDHDGNHDQHVLSYYSKPLIDLMTWCTQRPINKRPSAYELFQKTLEGMKKYQRIAKKEQADAENGWPFHSQVLYTEESQMDHRRELILRLKYESVNRAPLRNGIKTLDPGENYTPPVGKSDTRKTPPPPGDPNEPGTPGGRNGPRKTPSPPGSSRHTTPSSSKTVSTSNKSSSDSERRNLHNRHTKTPLEPAHDAEEGTRQYKDFMREFNNPQTNQPPANGPSHLPPRTPTPPVIPPVDDGPVVEPAAPTPLPPDQPTVLPPPNQPAVLPLSIPPPRNILLEVRIPRATPAPARPARTAAPRGGKSNPAKPSPAVPPRRGPPRQAKAPKQGPSIPAAKPNPKPKPKAQIAPKLAGRPPKKQTPQRGGKSKPATTKPKPKPKPTPKPKPKPKPPARQTKTKISNQSTNPKPNGGPATRTRGRPPKSAPPQPLPVPQNVTVQAPGPGRGAGTKRKSDDGHTGVTTRGSKKVRFSDDEDEGAEGEGEDNAEVLEVSSRDDDQESEDVAVVEPPKNARGRGKGRPKAKRPTKTPAKGTTAKWKGRLRKR